jgi:hypothetical protein
MEAEMGADAPESAEWASSADEKRTTACHFYLKQLRKYFSLLISLHDSKREKWGNPPI